MTERKQVNRRRPASRPRSRRNLAKEPRQRGGGRRAIAIVCALVLAYGWGHSNGSSSTGTSPSPEPPHASGERNPPAEQASTPSDDDTGGGPTESETTIAPQALAAASKDEGDSYAGPSSDEPAEYVEPSYAGSGTCAAGYYSASSGDCVHSPVASQAAPAGASALCGDGTYSFSEHRSGTCSHHGGVDEWL